MSRGSLLTLGWVFVGRIRKEQIRLVLVMVPVERNGDPIPALLLKLGEVKKVAMQPRDRSRTGMDRERHRPRPCTGVCHDPGGHIGHCSPEWLRVQVRGIAMTSARTT
jgi:hypothetical protein